MASSINADNGVSSGSAGLKSTADSSGVLALQTNGTTAISIDASQAVSFTNQPTYSGGTANGVAYLNGSKVLTTGSALVFDGTNLGVGVTPSAWSLGKALEVGTVGNALWSIGSADIRLTSNVYYASSAYKYATTNTASILLMPNDGTLQFSNAASGTAGTNISFTNRLTIDASGNLGVGVTPVSAFAGYKNFQIASQGYISSDTTSNGELEVNNNAYRAPTTATLTYINSAAATKYAQYRGEHRWFNAASGTAGNAITFTQAMTLDASSRLAIGVTSAATNVHIAGSSGITLGAVAGDTWRTAAIVPIDEGSTYKGSLAFYTHAAAGSPGAPTERCRITSGGDLLVGLTSVPANAVSAAGAASFGSSVAAIGYNSRSGVSGSYTNNRMNLYWNGSNARLYVDNTDLGQIAYVSDYRLKENIETQTVSAIERVNALRPVTFNFKKVGIFEGSSNAQEGFIAHEVQQVIASAVNGDKDAVNSDGEIQPQNLNWMPIVSVLVKAIQEQQTLIQTLTDRITSLEAK